MTCNDTCILTPKAQAFVWLFVGRQIEPGNDFVYVLCVCDSNAFEISLAK